MASALVGALRVVLSADTAEFKTGLGEASKATQQFTGQLSGVTTTVSSFSKAFGAMFTVGAITAAASKVIDYASNIHDLAEQTGLTTDSIQEMAHAAKQTGTSLEAFTNAAFKLGTNLADGTEKVKGATERLGLSYDALMKMSPDEQFKAIAAALGNVEDAQERNLLGVTLMGKGYKAVSVAISEGYADIARAAGISSKEQIDALEKAGDELDTFKSKLMVLGVFIAGSFAKSMASLGTALEQDFELIKSHTFDRVTQAVEDWGTIFGKAAEHPKVLGKAMQDLPAPIRAVSMSMEDQKKAAKDLDAQIARSIETNKAAQKAAEDFAQSLRALGGADAIDGAKEVVRQLQAMGGPLNVLPVKLGEMASRLREGAQAALMMGKADLAGQYTKLAETLTPVVQFQQRFNVTIGEFVPMGDAAANATEALSEQVHVLGGEVITFGPLLQSSMILPLTRFRQTVQAVGPEVQKSFENISDAFKNIGNTILAAVQGGGSVLSSIGSSIGMSIGKDLQDSLGGFLTRNLGKTLGDAFGAVLPGLGALLGPALTIIGSGLKKAFGIGINDAVKAANKSIATLRDELIKTHGPLEELEKKANAVGLSFAGNWAHQGEAGLAAFRKLVEEFNARWEELQEKRAELESQLSDTQSELDGLISSARDLGYEFSTSGEFIRVNFEAARTTADLFGVSLDGLGPRFRQQGIDAEASKIINAFTLLEKAGGDVGGILVGMKDEIGALVGRSILMGTTIPKNMEPWVRELIRTGQLTDENGVAITDLSTIKFGDPVATQFETIASKLQEVVDRLADILAQIAAIPTNRTMTVRAQYEDPGPPPNFGNPDPGVPRDPGSAVGTMGRFGEWFKNWGPETQTSLHGIEAVITPQQAPAFAMDVLGGMAPATGGGGNEGLEQAIARLERTLIATIPTMVADAARHGAQTSGRRR